MLLPSQVSGGSENTQHGAPDRYPAHQREPVSRGDAMLCRFSAHLRRGPVRHQHARMAARSIHRARLPRSSGRTAPSGVPSATRPERGVQASWSRTNAPLQQIPLMAAAGAGLATFWATQHSLALRCATGGVLAVCVALGCVPPALAVATLRAHRF